MALILVLVMLVLLTLLGAYALSTSSTELFISGSYRNSQLAFYSGAAGIDYGQENPQIYDNLKKTGDLWPVPGAGTGISADPIIHANYNTTPVGPDVKVVFLNSALHRTCPGSASDAELFNAYYYAVTSVGTGQGNSRVDIESQVCRMGPSTN